MALVPLSTQTVFSGFYPVEGAQLFAFDTGTTTPRSLFLTKDLDPTRIHPTPVVAADGCLPVMYAGVGDYDVRVLDAVGSQIHFFAGLPGEVAAATGNGFDPLRQIPTAAVVRFYGSGRRAGYVRANGGTIGSGSVDASERANDDCHDLFVALYGADPNLVVAGGRSPSGAEADWQAGKTITLPNLQNAFEIGSGDTYAVGATGGATTHTLSIAEMPSHGHNAAFIGNPIGDHNHSPSASNENAQHLHNLAVSPFTILQGTATPVQFFAIPATGTGSQPTGTGVETSPHSHTIFENNAGGHTPSGTVTITATGSATPFSTLPPYAATTAYLKL